MKMLVPGLLIACVACLFTAKADPPEPAAPKTKVARVWQGKVPKAKADEYEKYLTEEGVKKFPRVKGNLGVQMFRRDLGEVTEFVVISYWPDRAAIRAYAGEDIDKTRFLPKDKDYLIDPEPNVRHYDVKTDERGG
ncbi:MAG TPA: antibiotic biosynthesis monooxygenase family protein [Gemmata sp.]|nr:antibiotic biosynthesis monooxygenase family protein [Gemmata sp.]